MKYIAYTVATLTILYLGVHFTIPKMKQKEMNQTTLQKPYVVHDSVQTFYNSLEFISDLHCDALLWDWDLNEEHSYGHLDLPRMASANMAMQAFTIVSKTPRNMNFDHNTGDTDNITLLAFAQAWPLSTWFSLKQRALYQSEKLIQFAQENPNFQVITSKKSFKTFLDKRKTNRSLTGGFIGLEGAHPLENKLESIQEMYDAGVRMVGLTHFFDNEMGGSAHGVSKAGLTEFGKRAIREFEARGMLIDLAHASPQLITDVLNLATRPIIVSHTGVKGTSNSPRNLSDAHLKQIAKNGGIVGISFFKPAISKTDVASIVDAILYTKRLIGIQHIAIGSDFDGAVTTPFDVTGLPLLVQEMLNAGLSKDEIRFIMGENVKRILLEYLPET